MTVRPLPRGGSASYLGFLAGLSYFANIPKRPITRNSLDESFGE